MRAAATVARASGTSHTKSTSSCRALCVFDGRAWRYGKPHTGHSPFEVPNDDRAAAPEIPSLAEARGASTRTRLRRHAGAPPGVRAPERHRVDDWHECLAVLAVIPRHGRGDVFVLSAATAYRRGDAPHDGH